MRIYIKPCHKGGSINSVFFHFRNSYSSNYFKILISSREIFLILKYFISQKNIFSLFLLLTKWGSGLVYFNHIAFSFVEV